MSATEQTPKPEDHLPLRIDRKSSSLIATAKDRYVAIAWSQHPAENPYAEAEAFAAFLVAAVNAHAETQARVEALEAGLAALRQLIWLKADGGDAEALSWLALVDTIITGAEAERDLSPKEQVRRMNADRSPPSADVVKALLEASDAVSFFDRVRAASPDERAAVGGDNWDRMEKALRACAALSAFPEQTKQED